MMKKAGWMRKRLDELKTDTSVNKDSVALLYKALEEWQTDIVEVPGNDEPHYDHHDHAHGTTPLPDVTEEQMLEIQKELDKKLSTIGKKISRLKPESDHINDSH